LEETLDLSKDRLLNEMNFFEGINRMGVSWFHLAQDMDQWQVLINMVINCLYHNTWLIYLLDEQLLA